MPIDHDVPGGGPSVPAPLSELRTGDRRRTAAEEARTLLAAVNHGTLATLTEDGEPWASFVAYGLLPDGSPVLCVSRLAEHGRNLAADPRASISVTGPLADDPLATPRVSLLGRAVAPTGDALQQAREAHLEGVPAASFYIDYGDFTTWVIEVERVRWVGGYGRMASASSEDFATAAADPVATISAGAVTHLNEDHADALLLMARHLAGFDDATAATCLGADRYGLDLYVDSPRGSAPARVTYAAPLAEAGGLRAATVELTRRARGD